MKLRLAKGLALPLETVTEKLAWMGRTGSGKTYGATKLAELMLQAGAQIIALDPVGVWSGLRIGEVELPIYVFGGLRKDFPLEPTGGALMADLLVDRGISAVLDVSQFGTDTEHRRFATDFATRFFQRKKAAPTAVHLFIEEAQEFLPQDKQHGDETMLHAMQRLWKLGRNFGIGGSLISQRPQDVNKKALEMSGTMFAFQTTGPNAKDAIERWIGAHGLDEKLADYLPKLRVGEPWLWSPTVFDIDRQIQILPKDTADVSSTPKVGSRAKERPLTKIDVDKIAKAMEATIERTKAEDPRELRRQIAELKRELTKSGKPGKAVAAVPGGTRQTQRELDRYKTALRDAMKFIVKVLAKDFDSAGGVDQDALQKAVSTAVKQIAQSIEKQVSGEIATVTRLKREASTLQHTITRLLNEPVELHVEVQKQEPFKVTQRHTHSNGLDKPNAAQRAFMTVLAQRFGTTTTRNQLAVMTGYSAKSSHVDNTISAMRTSGWAEGSRDALKITEAGIAALGEYESLPTGPALIDHWIKEAGAAAGAMLKVLVDAYPNTMTRDEIATATNYSAESSHVDNSISRLRTLQLVTGGRNDLRASEELING